MNGKLRHFLVSFIKSRRNRKHYLVRVNRLYKLAVNSTEWEDISDKKWTKVSRVHNKRLFLTKIDKFVRNLRNIQNLPLYVHELAYLWLSLTWKRLVEGVVMVQLEKPLRELDIDILDYNDKRVDPLTRSPVSRAALLDLFIDRIRVIFVSNIHCTHECPGAIRCNPVRPQLPGIDGRLNGLSVDFYRPGNRIIRLYGVVDRDLLRVYRNTIPKEHILEDIKSKYGIDRHEAMLYLNVYSLRDYLVHEIRQITNKVKQRRERVEYYKRADVTTILNEFHFMPDFMRIEFINMLLEFDLISHVKYVCSKTKMLNDTKGYIDNINMSKIDDFIFKTATPTETSAPLEEDAPYELRISNMNASKKVKDKAYEKLKTINRSSQGAAKAQKYLDGILKIPFGKIRREGDLYDPGRDLMNECRAKYKSELDSDEVRDLGNNYISIFKKLAKKVGGDCLDFVNKSLKKLDNSRNRQRDYLKRVADILEENVQDGHPLVKIKIRRLLAQWISGGQSGLILGLEGPPGNGKTTLIKHGLSKCIVDENGDPRPVGFIPLGGTANSSFLVGHGYTYLGSTWGRIVDILMESECMNPILLFDELDKVSGTESGREIIGTLTHLTDTTQNDEFYDKYFEGVPLDLSKALLIFTFNDRSKIDPILLDHDDCNKNRSVVSQR